MIVCFTVRHRQEKCETYSVNCSDVRYPQLGGGVEEEGILKVGDKSNTKKSMLFCAKKSAQSDPTH